MSVSNLIDFGDLNMCGDKCACKANAEAMNSLLKSNLHPNGAEYTDILTIIKLLLAAVENRYNSNNSFYPLYNQTISFTTARQSGTTTKLLNILKNNEYKPFENNYNLIVASLMEGSGLYDFKTINGGYLSLSKIDLEADYDSSVNLGNFLNDDHSFNPNAKYLIIDGFSYYDRNVLLKWLSKAGLNLNTIIIGID